MRRVVEVVVVMRMLREDSRWRVEGLIREHELLLLLLLLVGIEFVRVDLRGTRCDEVTRRADLVQAARGRIVAVRRRLVEATRTAEHRFVFAFTAGVLAVAAAR